MDANYSNGSSIYHGFTTNLRKRFNNTTSFLRPTPGRHAIDDSPTAVHAHSPGQLLPGSTGEFDFRSAPSLRIQRRLPDRPGGRQRLRRKFFSDWTFAPIIEVASGRPFNILTGSGDNLQLSSLTSRPNTVVNPACEALDTLPLVQSILQRSFSGTLHRRLRRDPAFVDGTFGRNAAVAPWTLFDDCE